MLMFNYHIIKHYQEGLGDGTVTANLSVSGHLPRQ